VVSDFACFILYYIIGYRKKVVFSNLKQAFPEKSEKDRKSIARKFYRNFTDNFIEFIKLLSASPACIKKHFRGDYSIPLQLSDQGKRCQALLAHNFNWEWGCLAVALNVKHLFLVVYMPISNKIVDKIFIKVRSKTGGVMLSATDMRNAIIPYRNSTYMLALVADQNPGNPANAFWFNFFGKATPFVRAPESGARRGNIPVLFCKIIKERRGHYKIFFEMLEENPARLKEGELTEKYVDHLQKFISEYPEMWLWSHRRWKWDWKESYSKVIK
jgi:KDO2-lipid IV(A) lauroyltransferase